MLSNIASVVLAVIIILLLVFTEDRHAVIVGVVSSFAAGLIVSAARHSNF